MGTAHHRNRSDLCLENSCCRFWDFIFHVFQELVRRVSLKSTLPFWKWNQ